MLASSISIAAGLVLWRTRNPADGPWIDITKPTGLPQLTPSDDTWRFNNLNKFSIVVWQLGGFIRVVESDSPLRPRVLTGLSNRTPIFVQVNDLVRNFGDNFGAFDMWIRVDSR